jgi:hypothetical protein
MNGENGYLKCIINRLVVLFNRIALLILMIQKDTIIIH